MDTVQKSCELNVGEVKKLYGNVNEFQNNNKEMCKSIEEKNINMCNEIKKVIKETNKNQTKMSYAESVKKTVLPDVNKQVPLIVKPKEKQGVEKTREALNDKVDPVNLKITGVENRRNGTVVIQSENSEEREKIKNAIENELNDGYEIKVPKPIELRVKITDMTFVHEEKEIIEKLKKQNPSISNAEFKIIEKYEIKRNNKKIYNVKMAVDNETYTKMMEARKVNIGWERCRVFDGTDVTQCLKCRGYNHIAKECRNQEICLRCHGQHKTNQCKNTEQIMKCINCMKMNNKLNMDLDENHFTNNRECPVYQNKLNLKMRRTGLAV